MKWPGGTSHSVVPCRLPRCAHPEPLGPGTGFREGGSCSPRGGAGRALPAAPPPHPPLRRRAGLGGGVGGGQPGGCTPGRVGLPQWTGQQRQPVSFRPCHVIL